jgi:hypothetical protein
MRDGAALRVPVAVMAAAVLVACRPAAPTGGGETFAALDAATPAPDATPGPDATGARALEGTGARDFAGRLGKEAIALRFEVHGSDVRGSYLYKSIGTPIPLEGTRAGGVLRLEEHVGGQPTGHLELAADPAVGDWALSGTWTAPGGRRKLSVELEEGPPFAGRLVAEASKDAFIDYATRRAKMAGRKIDQKELAQIAVGPSPLAALAARLDPKADRDPALEASDLRVADVDNDGTPDFVVIDRGFSIAHGDFFLAAYAPTGETLRPLAMPDVPGVNGIYRIDVVVRGKQTVLVYGGTWPVDGEGDVVCNACPACGVRRSGFTVVWERTEATAREPFERTFFSKNLMADPSCQADAGAP